MCVVNLLGAFFYLRYFMFQNLDFIFYLYVYGSSCYIERNKIQFVGGWCCSQKKIVHTTAFSVIEAFINTAEYIQYVDCKLQM